MAYISNDMLEDLSSIIDYYNEMKESGEFSPDMIDRAGRNVEYCFDIAIHIIKTRPIEMIL